MSLGCLGGIWYNSGAQFTNPVLQWPKHRRRDKLERCVSHTPSELIDTVHSVEGHASNSNLTEVTPWHILTNENWDLPRYDLSCVVPESNRQIVALCPNRHFAGRTGVHILDRLPLGLRSVHVPVRRREERKPRGCCRGVLNRARSSWNFAAKNTGFVDLKCEGYAIQDRDFGQRVRTKVSRQNPYDSADRHAAQTHKCLAYSERQK